MPRCRHWKRQASKIIADVKICKTHNHCIQFFLKEGYFLKGIWILIYYLREFTVTYQHLSFFLSSLITMTRSIRISSTDLCPELHTHVYTDFWTCSCRSHTLNKSKISLFILPRKLLHVYWLVIGTLVLLVAQIRTLKAVLDSFLSLILTFNH